MEVNGSKVSQIVVDLRTKFLCVLMLGQAKEFRLSARLIWKV